MYIDSVIVVPDTPDRGKHKSPPRPVRKNTNHKSSDFNNQWLTTRKGYEQTLLHVYICILCRFHATFMREGVFPFLRYRFNAMSHSQVVHSITSASGKACK